MGVYQLKGYLELFGELRRTETENGAGRGGQRVLFRDEDLAEPSDDLYWGHILR